MPEQPTISGGAGDTLTSASIRKENERAVLDERQVKPNNMYVEEIEISSRERLSLNAMS